MVPIQDESDYRGMVKCLLTCIKGCWQVLPKLLDICREWRISRAIFLG